MDTLTSTPPPISSTTTIDGDKLSGKLIIKAQLGNDIRKMMIHNEDLTLNGKTKFYIKKKTKIFLYI
ncbi:unnamed protein product [Rotaria sp. Silwood1]|nr:unnamed protein product [Rotaria sp. Silwood1]